MRLILEAATVDGLAVLAATVVRRWRLDEMAFAALGATTLTIVWRAIANALALNTDFMPAVSVGDVGCLLAGSIVPLATYRSRGRRAPGDLIPAIVGGSIGFVVNVIIL